MDHFLNLFWICYSTASVFTFWPEVMWDPSSLIWDQTHNPYIERWSLNHWAPKEVLPSFPWWFLSSSLNSSDPGPSHREDPCLGVWQWLLAVPQGQSLHKAGSVMSGLTRALQDGVIRTTWMRKERRERPWNQESIGSPLLIFPEFSTHPLS